MEKPLPKFRVGDKVVSTYKYKRPYGRHEIVGVSGTVTEVRPFSSSTNEYWYYIEVNGRLLDVHEVYLELDTKLHKALK